MSVYSLLVVANTLTNVDRTAVPHIILKTSAVIAWHNASSIILTVSRTTLRRSEGGWKLTSARNRGLPLTWKC